jgi:hypothetical protein
MRALRKYQILLLSLLGTLATLSRIQQGWSSLDDGFYAYVADRILHGSVLHRDVFSQYLGYQHVLHALLFSIFKEDYLVLRYPLPILTFLSSITAAIYFKKFGGIAQLAAITLTTGFSYLLFNTPSTSWTCEYLALLLCLMLSHTPASSIKSHWGHNLAIGIVLGIAFGIRHPTAIFLCFAILTYQISNTQKDLSHPRIASGLWTPLIGLALLLLYATNTGSLSDFGIWFAAPTLFLLLAIYHSAKISIGTSIKSLAPIATGFILAISPIVIYTIITGTFAELSRDLGTFPANYSEILGIHTWYMWSAILTVLTNAPTITSALTSIIILIPFTFPLFVFAKLALTLSKGRLATGEGARAWLKSPLTVVCTFHCLVILGLIRDMYLSYLMPLVMLSLLELLYLSRPKILKMRLSLAMFAISAMVSFFMMSARVGVVGTPGFFGLGRIDWVPCSFKRCSLKVSELSNGYDREMMAALNKLTTPNSTVTVIPWGFDYAFSNQPANESALLDARIPLYRKQPAMLSFKELIKQPDPIFVINTIYASWSAIDPNLADLLMANSYEVYRNKVYLILKPRLNPDGSINIPRPGQSSQQSRKN